MRIVKRAQVSKHKGFTVYRLEEHGKVIGYEAECEGYERFESVSYGVLLRRIDKDYAEKGKQK